MPTSAQKLPCGVHKCPLLCHMVSDHSKSLCMVLVDQKCERQHKLKVRCSKKGDRCRECVREDQEHERRLKRDLELERKRLARQEAYRQEMQQIEDEIDFQRRIMKYMQEEEDEKKEMAQKRKNAKELLGQATKMRDAKAKAEKQAVVAGKTQPAKKSGPPGLAEEEWSWLKKHDGAQIEAMDDLMEMIGLETVKQEFLSVKTKVDTLLKQNTSLSAERFNCTMLGNPGTGKHLVFKLARLR